MNCKVTIGYELPKERWLAAAEDLRQTGPIIAQRLQAINFEGKGKQDAEDFMTDILLACTALNYVSECATDKCRFVPIPDKKEREP